MKLASFLIPALVVTITALAISCSKSGGNSKPQISIESINTTVQPGEQLDVTFKFSISSGTLSKGTLVAIRNWTNPNSYSPVPGSDTLLNPIPEFPDNSKGTLEYTAPYQGYLHITDHINDTLIFKFAAISASGKSSDTISTPPIVIVNP